MKRLIIDTDPGIDDAQAITMALKSDDLVEVVAFTTCHGNVDVGQASVNLQRILKANDRTNIPVYSGAICSLVGSRIASTHFHGNDGLGDVPDTSPPEVEIQSDHAVQALLRIVNENTGQLTLVCLAPLTNIALAIRLDPDFGKKLKECVIMGGNYKAKGNITASAEFNFVADPEAARVVLRELRCPKTTLVTWELCNKGSFTWTCTMKRIIIDTDAGIDDGQAIVMALNSDDLVEVVAITTCHGNVAVDQVTRNVQRILKVTGRSNIPVYRGATCSLIGDRISSPSSRHGKDGFGDVPDHSPPEVEIQSKHAVQALLTIVNENQGQLTLVCLAPLTNIALAIRLDPDFGRKLKACVIMGGCYKGKSGITVSADFNFYADPEAARVVLKELNCSHVALVTFDLCIEYSFTWEWYEKFINTDTTLGRFFKEIESKSLEPYYSECKRSCDPLTMAIVLDPDVITQRRMVCCDVELAGELTRGQLIIDWENLANKLENVFLIEKIDVDRHKELFMRILKERNLEKSIKSQLNL